MQLRTKFFAVALAAAGMIATSAQAATVTYILDTQTVPGNFTLWADVSSGDNQGLAFFDVPLLGNVTAFNNVSPLAINAANFAPVGFSDLRSPTAGSDPVAGPVANPEPTGSQNVISGPIPNLITGFGQEASSWVTKGITTAFAPDATADIAWGAVPVQGLLALYDNPLRLATGTFTGELSINAASLNLVASVWNGAVDNRDAQQATVVLDTVGGGGGNTPPAITPLIAAAVQNTNGQVITQDFNATDAEDPAGPFDWSFSLSSFTPLFPGGVDNSAAPTIDANGLFSWDTTGAARGSYVYSIDTQDPDGADAVAAAQFTVTITAVPEPSTLALFGLAMIGGMGLVRRRNG